MCGPSLSHLKGETAWEPFQIEIRGISSTDRKRLIDNIFTRYPGIVIDVSDDRLSIPIRVFTMRFGGVQHLKEAVSLFADALSTFTAVDVDQTIKRYVRMSPTIQRRFSFRLSNLSNR